MTDQEKRQIARFLHDLKEMKTQFLEAITADRDWEFELGVGQVPLLHLVGPPHKGTACVIIGIDS